MNFSTSPQCDTVYLLPSVTDWSIITALASWQGGTDRRRLSVIPPPDSTFSHLLSVSLVSYSIDRRTDRGHLFNVYPMNGSVFLLKRLDRETTAWHNISVVATELSKSSRVWDCLHCSCDILIRVKLLEERQHSLPWINNKNQTPECRTLNGLIEGKTPKSAHLQINEHVALILMERENIQKKHITHYQTLNDELHVIGWNKYSMPKQSMTQYLVEKPLLKSTAGRYFM